MFILNDNVKKIIDLADLFLLDINKEQSDAEPVEDARKKGKVKGFTTEDISLQPYKPHTCYRRAEDFSARRSSGISMDYIWYTKYRIH